MNVVKDVAKNLELVAGTGDQCLPYDDARCGDGGKAVEATLTNPRGIVWRLLWSKSCVVPSLFFFSSLLFKDRSPSG